MDLKEEEVGQIAKVAYGQDGQTFDIIYPNADKFPGLADRNKVKYSVDKIEKSVQRKAT